MKTLYLWINFFTVLIPFLFSFHPKLKFYKNFKPFIAANGIVAVVFIVWDSYFTQIGVWGFNPNYVSGISLLGLPLEEILFFICIPFACVFTYHCLNLFFTFKWSAPTEKWFVIILSGMLFFAGMFHYPKLYTTSTFISLSLLLLLLKFVIKIDWLPKFVMVYPVILIPFFIVNGALTGNGLEQPIVWYNNSENMGLRITTIPVEDIFYGFELLLLNVFLYEFFKKKWKKE